MPSLERDGDVFVLDLCNSDGSNPENRFHPDWMAEVHSALDEITASSGPAALVTTATGKFFTNGLDVDHAFSDLNALPAYLDLVHAVYTRLLTLPVPTVACVQGHAFGAGAMLALCHDAAIMRADRGYFCLPEVSLGMPFTPGMSALVTARMPARTALSAMTSGRRYGGADAVSAGIVDAALGEDELLSTAKTQAAALAPTRGPNLAGIKASVHGSVLAALSIKTTAETFAPGQ